MPKRPAGARHARALQLPLFPDQAALTRVRPELNEWRFYRLAVLGLGEAQQ